MADSNPRPSELAIPWESRLIGLIPLPPVLSGVAVSLALILAATACFAISGEPIFGEPGGGRALSPDFMLTAVLSVLVGYSMASGRFLTLTIARDLIDAGRMRAEILAPENDTALHGMPRSSIRRSRWAGAIGILVGCAMVVAWDGPESAGGGLVPSVADVFRWKLTPLLIFLMARAGLMTAIGASARATDDFRIAPGEIDLLDMRRHLVEGRVGLRLSLVWIVGSTIASLLFVEAGRMDSVVPLILFASGIALMALVLPVRRLHIRIRDAKRRETKAVRARLAVARDAVMRGEPESNGRLADLLAYADHLDDVREWPFDNRTLSRFVLYLLIPVGSWLGGALVERLVGRILD